MMNVSRLVSIVTSTMTARTEVLQTSTTLSSPLLFPSVISSTSVSNNSATMVLSTTVLPTNSSMRTLTAAAAAEDSGGLNSFTLASVTSFIPSFTENNDNTSEQSTTDDVIVAWLRFAWSSATETTQSLRLSSSSSSAETALINGARDNEATGRGLQLERGDMALYMPAYAWILALLFGVCCGLALLAIIVSVFKCIRRRSYSRLGADRLNGGLIPAYMQYVYGSALVRSGLGSRSDSVVTGNETPSTPVDATPDYTFVGVSIPLLQDVTRI